ncbi:MAG: tRNA pseudouridine(55) synthase TruB [candidate division Zixibacteria bacterium]|nr:tRNA pseudouridine(55) synthase TruB [candidate division Zixibacteria bacterium]
MDGVLLIDKPTGMTSHDTVAKLRKILGQRRVGHTGTLDPEAEGLMIICLGRATKIARFVSDFDKTYEAEICLGRVSSTYDREGVDLKQEPQPVPELSEADLAKLLDGFSGRIRQKVPAYSAVHIDGERLYKLARAGVEVDAPEREVEIKEIALSYYREPMLFVTVTCSKGTYIRSLAHDIGQKVGCGGYLSKLRRTAVGNMTIDCALTLESVALHHQQQSLSEHLVSYDNLLGFPAFVLSEEFQPMVVTGRDLSAKDVVRVEGDFAPGDRVFLKSLQGDPLAVGTAEVPANAVSEIENGTRLFSYIRVLN